jgi:hypothetical protein
MGIACLPVIWFCSLDPRFRPGYAHDVFVTYLDTPTNRMPPALGHAMPNDRFI